MATRNAGNKSRKLMQSLVCEKQKQGLVNTSAGSWRPVEDSDADKAEKMAMQR